MPDPPECPKKKFRWRRSLLWLPLLLTVMPFLLIFIAGILVNCMGIPSELENPPQVYIVQPTQITSTTTPLGIHFIPAHRVRAETDATNRNYPAFLEAELRDRPDLEGARQYLELSRYFKIDKNREDLMAFNIDPQNGQTIWIAGQRLPKATADWLTSHTELVGKFMKFANGPGLPSRSIELLACDPHPDAIPIIEIFPFIGVHILSAEGQRHFERGDLSGAETCWRAAIKLSLIMGEDPYYWGAYAVSEPIMLMGQWLAGPVPRETVLEFRAMLADVHKKLFPAGGRSEFMRLYFLAKRKELIARLNEPWNSPTFGWDLTNDREFFLSTDYFELPRIDRMAIRAVMAMDKKAQGPHILRDFDHNVEEMTRLLSAPWPDIVKHPPDIRIDPWAAEFYAGFVDIRAHFDASRVFALASEARLNLFRAAIEYKLASLPPAQITDRESPWRDPFTEMPMNILQATPNTLRMYSVGPDLKSQRTKIVFDPACPGDIFTAAFAKRGIPSFMLSAG